MAQRPRTAVSTNTNPQRTPAPQPTSADLQKVSVLHRMAARVQMDPEKLQQTLLATVFQGCSREEFAMMLVVAYELKLNPLRKEIYAFPKKGGGIMPIVSVDGWITITNSQDTLDGFEFEDLVDDKGNIYAVTCTMHRTDRKFPISVTEYLDECKQDTGPWKKWPTRMLRHKAFIQAARYAFGFSGIYDEEEVNAIEGAVTMLPPSRATDNEGFAQTVTTAPAAPQHDQDGVVDDDGEHPAAPRAREAMDAAAAAQTIVDLKNVKIRFHDDVTAMPDEMRQHVEEEYAAAEARLSGSGK